MSINVLEQVLLRHTIRQPSGANPETVVAPANAHVTNQILQHRDSWIIDNGYTAKHFNLPPPLGSLGQVLGQVDQGSLGFQYGSVNKMKVENILERKL